MARERVSPTSMQSGGFHDGGDVQNLPAVRAGRIAIAAIEAPVTGIGVGHAGHRKVIEDVIANAVRPGNVFQVKRSNRFAV